MAQHSNGRGEDPTFLDTERLFRRQRPEELLLDGTVLASALGSNACSLNREKHSDSPECVLHPDCCDGKDCSDWVILVTTTGAVQNLDDTDGKGLHRSLRLVHRPLEICYPHSEVWYVLGNAAAPSELCPNGARKRLRAKLAMALSRLS